MNRIVSALVVAIVLGVSGTLAMPAVAQTISANESASISGTRWSGMDEWVGDGPVEIDLFFRADGVLVYSYSGNTYENGRWLQNERLVTFRTNSYFALYAGALDATGREVRGSMFNQRGEEGVFIFRGEQQPR